MIYKKFEFGIVLRILVIFLNLFAITYLLVAKDETLVFIPFVLIVILILLVVDLIKYNLRVRKELHNFLLHIKESDYSFNIKEEKIHYNRIFTLFDDTMKRIKSLEINKAGEKQLLDELLQQVHYGILILHQGKCIHVNPAAKEMLNISSGTSLFLLRKHYPDLAEIIEMSDGISKQMISLKCGWRVCKLKIVVNDFIKNNLHYKIISLTDIKEEAEQIELQSWNEIMPVVIHELINSVSPLSTLADTIHLITESKNGEVLNPDALTKDNIQDIHEVGKGISRRINRILSFAKSYKRLSGIPIPEIKELSVYHLLENFSKLMQPEFKNEGIVLEICELKAQTIFADESLIEQVLLNLVSNSKHALKNTKNPVIKICSGYVQTRPFIEILDNGKGIPQENIEKIYLPFFSTRKNGTGIGMAVCKSIMHAHGGSMEVESVEGEFTKVYLTF